jgi:hypothetical protein
MKLDGRTAREVANILGLRAVLFHPVSERSWRMGFANVGDKVATTTFYAICIR